MIWPPFAFYRCISVMNAATLGAAVQAQFGGNSDGVTVNPYKLSNLKPGDEVFNAIMMMYGCTVFFLIMTAYLSQVLPSKYGVAKRWDFPLEWIYKTFSKPENKVLNGLIKEPSVHGDQDVIEERQRVDLGQVSKDSPLIIKHLHKSFGKKVAVDSISFSVEKGIVFGLLGENGAGKTTLISVLTGLFSCDSGTAILAGYDTSTEMKFIHKRIGICPQYDIHWEDLTIEEHLLFYARLKDSPIKFENEIVEKSLHDVGLTGMGHRLTRSLSGGEKRRLSIAMALVGDPCLVFLDEPTTGLDPEVRRIVWKIIQQCRQSQTFLLTTHSMEEAEVLCQRIGIMSRGNLECIGSPLHLKKLYGTGFKITVKYLDQELAKTFMSNVLNLYCETWSFTATFATGMIIELLPKKEISLADLFEDIENGKDNHGIDCWSLCQTTLEVILLLLIVASIYQDYKRIIVSLENLINPINYKNYKNR